MPAWCLQSPLLIAVTIKRKIELKNVTKAKLLFPFLISTGLTFQPIIIPFSCKLVVKSDALPSPLQQTAFFSVLLQLLKLTKKRTLFFSGEWRPPSGIWEWEISRQMCECLPSSTRLIVSFVRSNMVTVRLICVWIKWYTTKVSLNLGLTTKSTALFFKNPPMCFAYVCNSHNTSHHAFVSVVT